jgi:hypothetical protein
VNKIGIIIGNARKIWYNSVFLFDLIDKKYGLSPNLITNKSWIKTPIIPLNNKLFCTETWPSA